MKDLQRAATAPPHSLITDPDFWRAQRSLAVGIAGGLASMAALAPLTYQHADGWTWLTVSIQLLIFWGIAIAIQSLARLEVDRAIAQLVGERASTELGRLKGGVQDRILLDRIATDILPHNPSHDNGVLRLFHHVIEESRDRRFPNATVLVQPFRDDSLGDLLRIQTVQRIAMQLGILGTFAGLILAMGELTTSGQSLLQPGALNLLFQALHISFSTSIAGLEVAIILAFLLLIIRRRQEELFRSVENACAALIALARNSIIRDEFLIELEQTRTALTMVGERVREQTREVESQTRQIRTGLDRMLEVRHDFDTFLERIREEQGVVLGEMKSVYQLISPRQTAEELKQSIGETNRQLTESFREELRESLEALAPLSGALQLLKELGNQDRDARENQARSLESSHIAFGRGVADLAEAVARLPQELAAQLEKRAHRPSPAPPPIPSPRSPSAPPPEAAQKLERINQGLESLAREMERNNFLLGELVRAHFLYRSALRRPREWWESLRRIFTGREGRASGGLP